MRLLHEVDSESKGYAIFSFLKSHGLQVHYELQQRDGKVFSTIWVINEDEVEKAKELLAQVPEHGTVPLVELSQEEEEEIDKNIPLRIALPKIPRVRVIATPVTALIVAFCSFLFLFFMTSFDLPSQRLLNINPVSEKLFIDFPPYYQKLAQAVNEGDIQTEQGFDAFYRAHLPNTGAFGAPPVWQGLFGAISSKKLQGSLFTDLFEGEVWRLVTPIFMHGGIFHILFNMLYAFYLGKMIERRVSPFRYLLLIASIAVFSNIGQYLVTGPMFFGFSGVIFGFAGFIRARQKKAPWEGYPLPKSAWYFLLFFIIIMLLFEVGLVIFTLITSKQLLLVIGNTAHLIGLVSGSMLGRISYFRGTR